MKEFSQLSIEQKAKRYEEAIARANELIYVSDKDSLQYHTVCHIFPELKDDEDDEDERIREVLVDYFKRYKEQEECGIKTFFGIPTDNIITWLEKQGEQKPQGKTALEAINEEKVDNQFCVKPIDKVEPKFKVGDWIVENEPNNYARFIQILEIIDVQGKKMYRISRDLHNDEDVAECRFIENNYHSFTIQDAKAGDVIYTPKGLGAEGIFLVSGWQQIEGTGKTLCSNIGYRVDDDEIVEGGLGAIWWKGVKDPFFPATKEQRELLFQKMKEAGYEWDVEKKELKKIKDEIEIPFGAKDSELQEVTYYIPKGFHAEIDGDKVVIKKGEKPIWSEMDKAITRAISSNLELLKNRGDGEVNEAEYQSEIKWLKALKDRVGCETNCATTKEWSEEDKTALGDALWCCKQAASIAKNENDMGNIWYAEKWLKSLKEREQPHPKQEWSKEDDTMLNVIIADLIGFSHSNTSTLESHFNGCIDWLKSIKDRYI